MPAIELASLHHEVECAVFIGVDLDLVAVEDAAIEDAHGQGVLYEALDGALQRAGTVGAVVAGFEDRGLFFYAPADRATTDRRRG